MIPCPCYHCEDRFVGCHSECNSYKDWHDKIVERSTAINRQFRIEDSVDAFLNSGYMRWKNTQSSKSYRRGKR